MIDLAKATKTLEDYFANVTKEQFSDDLRKFCPELFEQEEGQNNESKSTSLSRENDRLQLADRQLNLLTHSEIYHKAKEDNKIEIAAKLLHKGISVEEVAEILQLDVNTLAQPL